MPETRYEKTVSKSLSLSLSLSLFSYLFAQPALFNLEILTPAAGL